MRYRCVTPFFSSSSLSGESLSASRSDRNAIHFPSGDHIGSESCPDCVRGISTPLLSRHSQRSSRKRSASQSARSVAMATMCPSGERATLPNSTELKNSSRVTRGLLPGAGGSARSIAVEATSKATNASTALRHAASEQRNSRGAKQCRTNLMEYRSMMRLVCWCRRL